MAELPFIITDIHLAGRRLPDTAEQPVILAGEMVPRLGMILALDELFLVGLALLHLGRGLALRLHHQNVGHDLILIWTIVAEGLACSA